MEHFSVRELIVETVNKLFIYTDNRDWNKLKSEVFTAEVFFDMSSLGGQKANLSSTRICELWEQGFTGIDSVNHLAGNYLVNIQQDSAEVFAYATATHYKAAATRGTTREFTGTYNIHLTNTASGWKIDRFKYTLKYATGNTSLE